MIKLHRTCRDVTCLVLEIAPKAAALRRPPPRGGGETLGAARRFFLKSQDRPLRPLESVSLRLHWMICERCRRFRQQQRLMRVALDRWRSYRDSA